MVQTLDHCAWGRGREMWGADVSHSQGNGVAAGEPGAGWSLHLGCVACVKWIVGRAFQGRKRREGLFLGGRGY